MSIGENELKQALDTIITYVQEDRANRSCLLIVRDEKCSRGGAIGTPHNLVMSMMDTLETRKDVRRVVEAAQESLRYKRSITTTLDIIDNLTHNNKQ